jgi:RNA polymerase sigma-70 factor (ECF subfamily)
MRYPDGMDRTSGKDPSANSSRASFQTTHWSLVLAARRYSDPEAREALAALCGAYWYPLYAFLRRKGCDADAAQDLVQGFFARLLEKEDLQAVDPAKGRFRSFLMAACSHYLANRRDYERAQKRGGGKVLSIDAIEAETRYGREPAHATTPERLYLKRWATTLLEGVLDRLRREMAEAGKATLFEAIGPALLGESEAASYRQIGATVGLSERAARVAAHRMRRRYRELLREEVGRTLADPADVDEEIRDLFAALTE